MGAELFVVTGPGYVSRQELGSSPLPGYIPTIHMGPCESLGRVQGGVQALCVTRVWAELLQSWGCGERSCTF